MTILPPNTSRSARRNAPAPHGARTLRPPPDEPAPAPPGHATTALATAAGLQAHLHVLIVDDDPVNLLVASNMLTALGVRPALASDGSEAVTMAGSLRLDLILMDLQMPVLDGRAATRAIRRDERLLARTRVPVVAFTSFGGGGRGLKAHGIDGLLEKPCALDDLLCCLQRWCPPR